MLQLTMNQELSRAVADHLADGLFRQVESVREYGGEFPIRTVADVLLVGALIVRAVGAYYKPEKTTQINDVLAPIIRLHEIGQMDKPHLSDFFYGLIVEGKARPDEIRKGINLCMQLLHMPQLQRQLIDQAMGDVYGPVEPGRAPKIPAEAIAALACQSATVLPATRLFIRMKQQFPSTSAIGLIEFLYTDYQREAVLLVQNVHVLDAAVQQKEFLQLKTDQAKAVFLADCIAGDIFDLSPSYAHQRAEEGRRLLERQSQEENS
jgi:hypothetical protein